METKEFKNKVTLEDVKDNLKPCNGKKKIRIW